MYLTTLRQLLSLFSKIIRMLWDGINITGIVVTYLTVNPLNYVWKNWNLTQDIHSPTEFLTKDPPARRVETWMLGSALRLQFLLRLSWKIKTQLSRLMTQYCGVKNRFFIQYANLCILFCTIVLNYPIRSTVSEFGYDTLWDMDEYNRGSVPYLSVPRYKYIENKIIEHALRVFWHNHVIFGRAIQISVRKTH